MFSIPVHKTVFASCKTILRRVLILTLSPMNPVNPVNWSSGMAIHAKCTVTCKKGHSLT